MAEHENHKRRRGAWVRAVARRMKAWADAVLTEERLEAEREASRVRSLPVREEPPAPTPAPPSLPGSGLGPPEHWLRDLQARQGGPPTDWLERVKKGAPQLLDGHARPGQVLRAPFAPKGNPAETTGSAPSLPHSKAHPLEPEVEPRVAIPPPSPLPPGEGRGEGIRARGLSPRAPSAPPPASPSTPASPPEEQPARFAPNTLWGFDPADLQPPRPSTESPPGASVSDATAPPPAAPFSLSASSEPERPGVIPFPRARREAPRGTDPLRRSWPPLPRPEEEHWSLFSAHPGLQEQAPAPDAPPERAAMELADNVLFLEPPGLPRVRSHAPPPFGDGLAPRPSEPATLLSGLEPESARELPHPWPELPPASLDDLLDVTAELRLRERLERLDREQRGE